MKVDELMIGDWVVFKDKPAQVTIIDNWENEISYFDDDAEGVLTVKINDIEPISLTEEMLSDNGFIYDDLDFFQERDNVTVFVGDQSLFSFYDTNAKDYIILAFSFKYVHEFQHLLRLCGLNDLADNFIKVN